MPFSCEPQDIDGVFVLFSRRIKDGRGHFVETYRKRDLAELGIDADFVQDNEAFSANRGTLRGLHFQRAPAAQAKLVRVCVGAIFDVVVDLRNGSMSYGRWCGRTLTAAEGAQMFVPAGFAHGYVTLEPETLVCYKVDGYYDSGAEAGIHWNDPQIGIDWPIEREALNISAIDEALPLLRDVCRPLQFN